MMTVMTTVELPDGVGPRWDDVMRERMRAAEHHDGWIAGQILMPTDSLNRRVIIGVWETRSHWEAWHTDPAFEETRAQLSDLEAGTGRTTWHETLYHASQTGT